MNILYLTVSVGAHRVRPLGILISLGRAIRESPLRCILLLDCRGVVLPLAWNFDLSTPSPRWEGICWMQICSQRLFRNFPINPNLTATNILYLTVSVVAHRVRPPQILICLTVSLPLRGRWIAKQDGWVERHLVYAKSFFRRLNPLFKSNCFVFGYYVLMRKTIICTNFVPLIHHQRWSPFPSMGRLFCSCEHSASHR